MSLAQTGISEKLLKRLTASISSGKVMHAYIFESDSCVDKDEIALEFAKALLCETKSGDACDVCNTCLRIEHGNHEDVVIVEAGEHGNVKDEAIENLQKRLKSKPLVGDRTIAIIPKADSMTAKAQNRLLKTLEEPLGNAVIILLSDNIENLIQTIRSRCVIFRINDYESVPDGEMTELAGELAKMLISGEPMYLIKEKIEGYDKEKASVLGLLDALEYVYREILLGKTEDSRLYKRQYIYDAVSVIEKAKRDIMFVTGINASYMLKDVLLKIGG